MEILWLSVLHDILATIAISFERPQKNMLFITKQYKKGIFIKFTSDTNLFNSFDMKLIGWQSAYQCFVLALVYFYAPDFFNLEKSYNYKVYELSREDW